MWSFKLVSLKTSFIVWEDLYEDLCVVCRRWRLEYKGKISRIVYQKVGKEERGGVENLHAHTFSKVRLLVPELRPMEEKLESI